MLEKNPKKEEGVSELIKSYPTKEEVIKTLQDENPKIKNEHKYVQMMILLEIKRINHSTGILKGEYYESGKLEYRGSILVPLSQPDTTKPSVFDTLNPGEYRFYGFTLDSREMKIPEKISDFFSRSFEGSTLQDFIPFLGGRKKER